MRVLAVEDGLATKFGGTRFAALYHSITLSAQISRTHLGCASALFGESARYGGVIVMNVSGNA